MFPYIGGKSRHIRHLDNILPINADTFVDVFGGAGWVSTLSSIVAPNRIYNDYNSDLANCFEHFIWNRSLVLSYLQQYTQRSATMFARFRDNHFGNVTQGAERAAQFLYLMSHQYSGKTLKPTSVANFSSPHCKFKPIINKLLDPRWQRRLDTITTVTALDCIDVIDKYDTVDTVFYCDPPYFKLEHYYVTSFPPQHHLTLANRLKTIRGRFAISYYDFPELSLWYPQSQYCWHRYNTKKVASVNSGQHKPSTEIVITNY